MVVERKPLVGRLNVDASYKALPKGDYQNALNIRVFHGANGDVAVVKNTPANRVVTTDLVEETTSKCVGTIEDTATRRIFYFIYDPVDTNQFILCYRKDTDDIVPVLKGESVTGGLNFQDTPITGIDLIGDKLYWAEPGRVNEPRMINVERGITSYDGTYVPPSGTAVDAYTLPLAQEDLTLIRRQPKYPLELQKIDSSESNQVPDQDNNFIEGGAFQFSYFYEYTDGEESTLGPWSAISPYNTEDELWDTIRVSLPDEEDLREEVKAVKVVVRAAADVSVNNSNNWNIVKTWRRSTDDAAMTAHNTGSSLQFFFYNNFLGTPITVAEATKPFDSVPIYSEALTAGRDRIILGNNVEGYDRTEGVTLTASVVSQAEGAGLVAEYVLVHSVCSSGGDTEINDVVLVAISGSGDTAVDGYYFYDSGGLIEDAFDDATLPTVIALTPDDRIGAVADFTDFDLLALYSLCGGSYLSGPSYVNHTYTGTQPTVTGLDTPTSIGVGDRVFAVDSVYKVGVVYFDFAGRNNGVYTTDDARVVTDDRVYTQATYNTAITWTLPGATTDIPEWASHYAIVLTKNLTKSFFVWHYTSVVKYVSLDEDGNNVFGDTYSEANTTGIAWDISRLVKPGLGYQYDAASDDFLKVYPNDDSEPEVYRVTGQQGKYVITEAADIGDLSGSNVYETSLFEIYTPYKGTENEFFYEYGKVYAITSPGTGSRAHSETMGSLMGDVYVLERTAGAGTFKVEAMSPRDKEWNKWCTDHGRAFIEQLDSGQEIRETGISYSNTYIRGSSIRGLSSFDALDKVTIDDRVGAIRALVLTKKTQADGTVLLAVGEEETASIYLGETQFVDNQGQQVVASSGDVIGTINVLRGSYGTIHPESIVENDGNVYWWDYNRARVVRYAANGLTPISDYGLKSYWSRVARQGAATLNFYGGYDEFTDEYLLTVPDLGNYTGSEYLTDLEVPIGGGALTGGGLGISTLYEIEEGRPYRIEISNIPLGLGETLTFTVAGETIYSEVVVAANFEIEFTAPASGNIGYNWTGGSGATWVMYGAEISGHQLFDGRGKTLAFRDIDGLEGWSTAYSFVPEQFARIGDKLISFEEGQLWVHDDTDTWNTFFGKTYRSKISVVANIATPPKTAASIALETDTNPFRVHIRNEQPLQSTYTKLFDTKETVRYAGIKRDRLDPNGSGDYDNKMATARKLRGQFLQVLVEYQTFNAEVELRYIDVKYNVSSGHISTEVV